MLVKRGGSKRAKKVVSSEETLVGRFGQGQNPE